MFNKIKKGFKKAISSKPITYERKMNPVVRKQKKIAPKTSMRTYGQKGYRPSSGKGVSF